MIHRYIYDILTIYFFLSVSLHHYLRKFLLWLNYFKTQYRCFVTRRQDTYMHDCSRIALTLTNCHTLCSSRNLNGTIYIYENESFSTGRRENFSDEIASEYTLFTFAIQSLLTPFHQFLINHFLLTIRRSH